MNWESIIWKVLTVFGHWALVAGVFYFAKWMVSYIRRQKDAPANIWEKIWIYFCAASICFGISLIAAYNLGTHQERDDPDEPSITVVDWHPTNNQRWARGSKVFLVLIISSGFGLNAGLVKDKFLSSEERSKLNRELNKPSDDDW